MRLLVRTKDHLGTQETARARTRRGALVAKALAGAWRSPPPPLELTRTALADIDRLLLGGGAAGLVWRRLRETEGAWGATERGLRDAYRYATLEAAVRERHIVQTLTILRGAGVEPLLVKGWAATRYYPESGLRLYGDVDLCVWPEQYDAALGALSGRAAETGVVELHSGAADLTPALFEELYRRSRLVGLGNTEVRVLGPEDHLAYICMHLLRHGARRPLWLCDVAVALESLPENFDWDYFLRGCRRRTDWLIVTINLAGDLLGARFKAPPSMRGGGRFPPWLRPAVLRQWGTLAHHIGTFPMAFFFLRPAGTLHALRLRWPNPIQATVSLEGPFNAWPRLPFQLGECLLRTLRFAAATHARLAGPTDRLLR